MNYFIFFFFQGFTRLYRHSLDYCSWSFKLPFLTFHANFTLFSFCIEMCLDCSTDWCSASPWTMTNGFPLSFCRDAGKEDDPTRCAPFSFSLYGSRWMACQPTTHLNRNVPATKSYLVSRTTTRWRYWTRPRKEILPRSSSHSPFATPSGFHGNGPSPVFFFLSLATLCLRCLCGGSLEDAWYRAAPNDRPFGWSRRATTPVGVPLVFFVLYECLNFVSPLEIHVGLPSSFRWANVHFPSFAELVLPDDSNLETRFPRDVHSYHGPVYYVDLPK